MMVRKVSTWAPFQVWKILLYSKQLFEIYAMTSGWRISCGAPKSVNVWWPLLQGKAWAQCHHCNVCQQREAIASFSGFYCWCCVQYEKRRTNLLWRKAWTRFKAFRASNRAAHSMHSRISKSFGVHHRNGCPYISINSSGHNTGKLYTFRRERADIWIFLRIQRKHFLEASAGWKMFKRK